MIDFRSDTVTLPSPAMREAMYRAELGDDVYGEDPTVRRLEELAAEMLGKEAALYVASGTMGNLCAHLAHTTAGQEVICGERSHTFLSEAAGPARVGGLSLRTLPEQRGELDPSRVEAAIRPPDVHYPVTGLIWVEQPWNGWVLSMDNLCAINAIGRRHGIPVHLDGARIFNAAIYLGIPAREIAATADSVMFCVSKGLGAPVGSLLVGGADVIARARHARKMLGGGMRQAGVIAAAGVYALEHMVDRLQEDHDNARRLAGGLRDLPGVLVDRAEVQTNIFFFDLTADHVTPRELTARLREQDVLVSLPRASGRTFRLVTHYGITADDIERALVAFRQALA